MHPGKSTLRSWLVLLLFIVLSFTLYFPNINRSFSADDFLVLRRVGLDRILLIKGFFRPLSDLTLYFNYWLGGFNPAGYYIFGILVHGINCFFLFIFCREWKWTNDAAFQNRYAFVAAILFLCYPFHNESIVWILGRASSMAGTFGILSLCILVSGLSERLKIFLTCVCYFIGMTAYESIMPLPLIMLIILYKRNKRARHYAEWIMALASALILHLIIRVEISGAVAGSYGEGFFQQQMLRYGANAVKVAARLFLPPMQRSAVFALSFAILITLLFLFLILFRRRIDNKIYLLKLITILSIACLIPILSAVSTKTSESDRFLYFPSFFFCCCMAFILVNCIPELRKFALTTILLCTVYIFFLEKNNANWKTASAITKDILKKIGSVKNHKKIFIINLPDELNGAFIFRLGLKDALVLNNTDTSGLIVVNHLKRDQMLALPPVIQAVKRAGETDIPPVVTLKNGEAGPDTLRINQDRIYLMPGKENTVLYWNKQELIRLQ